MLIGLIPINGLAGWVIGLTNRRAEIAALSVLVDRVARKAIRRRDAIIDQAADELAKHHRHCRTL